MIIASIMTGTSADGVDIAVREFNSFKKIGFWSFDFSDEEQKYIKSFLWPNKKNMAEIAEFNFKFSYIVGKYFNKIHEDIAKSINYVVYHGQTVFHDPNKEVNLIGSTLQLGNGAVLANLIKKNVISDLRSSDVSVGGQGAPLVVYGDKYIFWDKYSKTIVFNIGGISNVSIIKEDGSMMGYDLGVGNALLDLLMNKWYNKDYDKDSNIAKTGSLNTKLLKNIIKMDKFICDIPPKSTGKEYYNLSFLNNLEIHKYKKADVLHTLSYYTALTINSIRKFEEITDTSILLIAGGGVKNPLILKYIKEFIPAITTTQDVGIDSQEREAASFSVLGYYFLNDLKIGQTTGAKNMTIPGCLYKYK